jgi:hypothetical protein
LFFGRRLATNDQEKEKTLMAKKTIPPLRVALGYSVVTDAELVTQALAAHDGVKAHPELFPNAPGLDALGAGIQSFQTAIAASKDGGKKAVAEKRKQRAALIKLLRPLGHYVEANCKDDPTILAASGFKAANMVRVPPQPVQQGVIVAVVNGHLSGQIIVKGKPLPKARSYVLRSAPIGADGKPGTWTEVGLTNPRAIPVNGLTPGTNHAFQLRALGVLGYGDWSEIATRIAV